MSPVTMVLISALSDFFLSSGGVILGGNIQAGGIPSKGVWLLAGITGIVAFFKEIKQRLADAQNTPRPPAPA